MEQTVTLFSPLMQFGFAGIVLILLAIVVWLIKQLLAVIRTNNMVIDRNSQALVDNTHAVSQVDSNVGDQADVLRQINDKLLARPCLIEK